MPAKKPNILILWGDDIGIWNISKFSNGMMGYRTPNIDRVANEGALFTDYYAQQSCTAGRASFITGQNPIRTGLTKVGMPGATVGLQPEDPTIAELLKPQGYATGQFGKNHLGDRNEFLPTVHGFDEFFGNLYHLNAEEEPELPDYPKTPGFKEMFGPRGVLHCKATDTDDATVDPRWGRVGKQTIKDTGPLTKKRMETVDEEITERAMAWMEEQAKADKPFFLWYNSTAMHFRTHVAEKNLGKSGQDPYSDRMVVHDEQIGMMLDKLDELGIADNTIVMYSTDNGPENDTWPDGANTPFRGQKDSNWEGGWRVPVFIRWPGKIKPGSVFNGIVSHIDMFPTLLSSAGNPDVTKQLLDGCTVDGQEVQRASRRLQHDAVLHGTGEGEPAGKASLYFSDDGDVMAVRVGDYKFNLAVQRANQMEQWAEPFVKLRVPHIVSLRRDPFERADFNSNTYWDWMVDHIPQMYLMQALSPDRSRTSRSSRRARSPRRSTSTPSWSSVQAARLGCLPTPRRLSMPGPSGPVWGALEPPLRDVAAFYERHPYPPPVDDLDGVRAAFGTTRAGAPTSHLFWPAEPTATTAAFSSPAAARRRPRTTRCAGRARRSSASTSARPSIAFTQELKAQTRARQSRRAPTPGRTRRGTGPRRSSTSSARACCTICPIPTSGCGHYATCSRPAARCTSWSTRRTAAPASICCRTTAGVSGVGTTTAEIRDLAASLKALPADHPLAPLLRNVAGLRQRGRARGRAACTLRTAPTRFRNSSTSWSAPG